MSVVVTGVFERGSHAPGDTERETDRLPYVCLACESPFAVLYHVCPDCGSYDVRRARWIED